MPVIGFISGGSPGPFAYLVRAFRQGLNESGYVEGQNLAIESRWAEGQYDRLPGLVADLVASRGERPRRDHHTWGTRGQSSHDHNSRSSLRQTVIQSRLGLTGSLSRPGGNITGVTQLNVDGRAGSVWS